MYVFLKSLEHSAEIQNHFLMLIFYVKSMSQISLISLLNMNGRKSLKFLHCVEMYPKRIHLEEEKMFFSFLDEFDGSKYSILTKVLFGKRPGILLAAKAKIHINVYLIEND